MSLLFVTIHRINWRFPPHFTQIKSCKLRHGHMQSFEIPLLTSSVILENQATDEWHVTVVSSLQLC